MPFDTSLISGSDRSRFQHSGMEFDDAAGAIKAARARKGDEVVVGYVNESGQLKYALVDARTAGKHSQAASKFDPSQLQFADKSQVVTAFAVDDDGHGFDTVRIVPPASGGDPVQQADAALSLARAATAKETDRYGFVRPATDGFRLAHSNMEWGEMVRSNTMTVLDHVISTMAHLDAAQAELTPQLETARAKQGDPAPIEAKLAMISRQRNELDLHRAMLAAELLTGPVAQDTVPGTAGPGGQEQKVGAFRTRFAEALSPLRARLAQTEQEIQTTTDPAARQALETQAAGLKQSIIRLEQKQTNIVEAQFHQGQRDMALAQIGGALAEATQDLTAHRESLTKLEAQAVELQKADIPYAERTAQLKALQDNIQGERTAINAGLATLIDTMTAQVDLYDQHAGKGEVPRAAVALLRDEITQLKDLQTSDGTDAKNLLQQVGSALNVIKTQHDKLIDIVSAGAKKWDGISPKEGLELLRIDGDVQHYQQAYRIAKGQVAEAMAAAKTKPPSHVLPITLGIDYDKQGNYNSCGTTSLAMVLSYMSRYDKDIPFEKTLVTTIDEAIRPNDRSGAPIDSFTAPNDIQDYVEDLGLKARQTNEATPEDLKRSIDQGIPPIILTDYEPTGTPTGDSLHYVVVKGYEVQPDGSTRWKIENPNGGTDDRTDAELMKIWGNLKFNVKGVKLPTGYDRLMISVVPPKGFVRDGNGDKHPVEDITLPPARKPTVRAFLAEAGNKVAGVINDDVEFGKLLWNHPGEVLDGLENLAGDAADAVGSAAKSAIHTIGDKISDLI